MAFSDDATQSVVLIKDDSQQERYANGYDKESFGTSWSVAKSFYAALILISIDKGEIQLRRKDRNYINFNDERDEITIRQLLNMSRAFSILGISMKQCFLKLIIWNTQKKLS